MFINTKVISFKRGLAECERSLIDGEITCKAKFKLILPSEIIKYKI